MEGNLSNFQVGHLPTVIYKPEFITESEETHLLDKIYEAPASKWKSLKNRRLQNWVPPWLMKITQRIFEESELFPSAINHVLINEYLPDQGIMPHQDGPAYFPVVAILSLGSPVVMDFVPHSKLRTCTDTPKNDVENKGSGKEALNIETDKRMDNHHSFSVFLMPRSLLIFKDNAYSDYLHGIKDSKVHQYDEAINDADSLLSNKFVPESEKGVEIVGSRDHKVHRTKNRVSLTCRLVLKVHKNLFKF
ncbi:alpha-ketoglutarate-dependent dioxygenase alkB homolog 6 isoform X2 [Jatropha curcas]|uniref:alpha-ketoglutarate-dependent dioxygenase alkB homolog 6 isoform X2 n=1 Tax=Jatropha curcas TaxID=180498 RepID=UPI0018930410|nr:alpha-ketoglutarate-dependent dioxygenase alkB homolog 6 isoform X2 [Jatropha curcas]